VGGAADAGGGAPGTFRCGLAASAAPGDWGQAITADYCSGDVYTTELRFPASGTSFDSVIRKFDADCNPQWQKSIAAGSDFVAPGGTQVVVDPDGNLIVYGSFWGTASLGGETFTATQPDEHAFVAKLSPTGQHVWSKHLGAAGTVVSPATVAVDLAGNILLSGGFRGSIDFGAGPLTHAGGGSGPQRDGFLAKLDPTGKPIFTKQFDVTGCSGQDCELYPGSVAVAPTGEIAIAGSLTGSIDLGAGVISATPGKALVAKFSATGTLLVSKTYGTDALGLGVSAGPARYDADGNLFVAGMLPVHGSFDFGNGVVVVSGDAGNAGGGAFIVKLDPNLGALWGRTTVPATQSTAIHFLDALTTDPEGSVTGVGWLTGPGAADFGDGPIYDDLQNHTSVWLAKYRADGGFVTKQVFEVFHGASCGSFVTIGSVGDVDQGGGALITGGFSGAVDFGAGTKTAVPGQCGADGGAWYFFARYQP
jgi:hypothetical protein